MSMTQTSMEQMHMGTNSGVRTRERGDVREERTTCIREVSSPPPANDTCKQGNSKSCKQQQLHHHRHPCCSLTAIPAVTAPPAITLAPMPNIQTCHPHQTLHLPSHTRMAMPSCAHTHIDDNNRDKGDNDNEEDREEDSGCSHSPPPSYPLSRTRHMQRQHCCTPHWCSMPWPLLLGPISHYLKKCHNRLWTVSDDIRKVVLYKAVGTGSINDWDGEEWCIVIMWKMWY